MPPNIPADPLRDESAMWLAASMLAQRPSRMLLYDADNRLQTAFATLVSQMPVSERDQLQMQQIDSPSRFDCATTAVAPSPDTPSTNTIADLPRLFSELCNVDLVYIADPLLLARAIGGLSRQTEAASRALALRLLAVFRDRVRGAVYASVTAEVSTAEDGSLQSLGRKDFFSLGYVDISREAAGNKRLYRYTLRDYKSVPGWLNSKYWAHPERWKITD